MKYILFGLIFLITGCKPAESPYTGKALYHNMVGTVGSRGWASRTGQ